MTTSAVRIIIAMFNNPKRNSKTLKKTATIFKSPFSKRTIYIQNFLLRNQATYTQKMILPSNRIVRKNRRFF